MLAAGIVMVIAGIIGGIWSLPPRLEGNRDIHVKVAWYSGAIVVGGLTFIFILS